MTRQDVRCGCANRVHDSRAVAYKLRTLKYGKKGKKKGRKGAEISLHQGVLMGRAVQGQLGLPGNGA